MTSDDLLAVLNRWDLPTNSLSSRTTIVRYESNPGGGPIVETLVPVWIESTGGQRSGRTGNWWIDGDARFAVASAVPYVFPTTPDGVVSERVDIRKNVDALMKLLSTFVNSMHPVSSKVYTDAGEFFPFNAHCAYFAQPEVLIRDIQLIRDLYEVGDPVLQLPPLKEIDGPLADFTFHLWRNSQDRRRVRDAFSEAVRLRDGASVSDILTIAEATSSLLGRADPGLIVADDKAPFNSFLDWFYVEILALK